MSDDNDGSFTRGPRVEYAQTRVILDFIENHPEMAFSAFKERNIREHWEHLTRTLNSMAGARKSAESWAKLWQIKRRSALINNDLHKKGRLNRPLNEAECKILKICSSGRKLKREKERKKKKPKTKTKYIKKESKVNGTSSIEDVFLKDVSDEESNESNTLEIKSFGLMNTMIDGMEKQASALSKIAQDALTKAKAMEQIAEASLNQALCVDKLAVTLDTMAGTVYNVRNALLGIDYTLKRWCDSNASNRQVMSDMHIHNASGF